MKKIFKFTAVAAALALMFSGCQQGLDTDQYGSEPTFSAFAPNPIYRGGELSIIGSYLENVSEVQIPGVDAITDIKVEESGAKSRISVKLPNTSEAVGKIVLITKDGKKLSSKADLTYTEPVVFEDFSPKSAMPGDVITVTGDYMNLIKEVIFEGPAYVTEIKEASRHSLKVVVPATAISGKLILGDTNEVKDPDNVANKTYSAASLTIGDPTVTKAAEATVKSGDVVTVKGAYLNMIKEIVFEGVTVTDFTVAEDGKSLTVKVPSVAKSGEFSLVSYAGKSFTAGAIKTVAPSGLVATPLPVKNGEVLTITGKDLDLVETITFPKASAATPTVDGGKILATVPMEAVEGDIELKLFNGDVLTLPYTLVVPTVTEVTPTALKAGESITLKGTDLDLVSSATLGGKAVNFSAEKNTITIYTDNTSVSGKIKLVTANGTEIAPEQEITLSYDSLVITLTMPSSAPIMSEVVLTGSNFNLVENIYVGNVKVTGYILRKDDEVRFLMPDQSKVGTYNIYYHLFSGDVEQCPQSIEVTLQEETKVIWEGNAPTGGWSGSMSALSWGGYDWSTVAPGTRISMFYDVDPSVGYINIRFGNGSWAALPTTKTFPNADGDGNIVPDPSSTCISFELSAADLDQLVNAGGLVMCGAGYNVRKVTLTTLISKEIVLWEGSAVCDDWGNQPYFLSDEGIELREAGAKAGQEVRFYVTPTASDWKVQIVEGHWGPTYLSVCSFGADTEGGKFTEYDLKANGGCIILTLTQEMLDAAFTKQWWGGSFLGNGDNLIFTKITLL